jgi:integrase
MNTEITIPHSDYWHTQFSRSLQSRSALKRAVAEIFKERLWTNAPDIWLEKSGLKLSEDESDAILSSLERGLPLCQQEIVRSAFRQGLSGKNGKESWRIALPPLRSLVANYANLVKPQHAVLLKHLFAIMQVFQDQMHTLINADRETLAGAIAFSAAAYDGQVDRNRLAALLRAEISAISFAKDTCIIDLGKAGVVFPSAITQSLLFAFHRRFRKENFDITVKHSFSALANHLCLAPKERYALEKRLPSLCRAWHSRHLPGHLLAYAHGINRSTSFSVAIYHKLIGVETECDRSITLSAKPNQLTPNAHLNRQGPREQTMQAIRRILETLEKRSTKEDRESAKEAIAKLVEPDGTWPIQRILAEWGIVKIDETAKKDGAFSSLTRYFSSLWYPLFVSALDFDPRNADTASLEDWIEEALPHHKSESSQLYFQGILPEFLAFLHKQYGLPKLQLDEIGGWLHEGERRVNANWITPQQFDRAIELLKSGKITKDPKLAHICVLVARICYRKGTRRREPLQASVMDLQISKTPELVIRESQYGSLKSDQATRRLPLGLMPNEEANELLEHAMIRRNQSGPRAPLFASLEDPTKPIEPETVYRYIKKALQLACGRSDVVIHLLRHSFANTTLLQLESASNSTNIPTQFQAFSHKNFSPERCNQVWKAVYGHIQSVQSDAGEKNLFAVSLLLGHLSPTTTLKSYIHTMDLLVHLALASAQPEIANMEVLSASIGLKKSQTYKIAKVKGSKLNLVTLLPKIQQFFLSKLLR